jgi:RND family efflux transporter MFP subunit
MRFFTILAPVVLATSMFGQSATADSGALVTLATVRTEALHQQIVAYGSVAADPGGVTTVSIPRDSMIVAVAVRLGQMVQRGDAIATVETAPAAAAQFAQAQSSLVFARKDLEHTRALYAEQLATKSQLASAEKAYSDAQAAYRQQTRIGANHPREVLRAGVEGVVTSIAVSPGDRVASNAVVASIAQRDRLVLNLGLDPGTAASVPVGAPVHLFSPQNNLIDFRAAVASVAAMMDPQSRLVNAVVSIPKNIAAHLIFGMTLEAHIDLPVRNGLVIPKSALMTDERGNYVFIVRKGNAHRQDVRLAFEAGTRAMVAGGLSAGEQVVAVGSAGLEDGMAVRTK